MSLQCICSVLAWYTTPCPQCERQIAVNGFLRRGKVPNRYVISHPHRRTCLNPSPEGHSLPLTIASRSEFGVGDIEMIL